MTFQTLGLSDPILKAIAEKGYQTPSPIQAKAIPVVLEGHDVMAAAQTGTGKTAGFTLPLLDILDNGSVLQANQARALILTPTRELAAQVAESVATYGRHLPLRSAVVFGGVNINPQMKALRKGADVLIATPGRLLDLYQQNAIRFKQLEVLVLDEADRMLDMGFIHDIRKIIALLPKQRQNLMFSATFSDEIRGLAKTIVHKPVEIAVAAPNAATHLVKQWIYTVDQPRKMALLTKLMRDNDWSQVLVFSRTKHGANRIARYLNDKGITATAIHGNKSQPQRTRALAEFKQNKVRVLVATDIAARGLDINQLPQVVNFDLPNVPEDYVHRIGRTGRAGAEGQAVSLVSADEFKQLSDIEHVIKELLPREQIAGFEPLNAVPESSLDRRAPRPKKPKKPKQNNPARRRSSASSRKGSGDENKPRRERDERGEKAAANKSGKSASKNKPSGNGASPWAKRPKRKKRPAAKTQSPLR